VFSAKIGDLHFYFYLLIIVVNTENIAFLCWIAIKIEWKKLVFDVPVLDLDQPFVKLGAKLMAHPVCRQKMTRTLRST